MAKKHPKSTGLTWDTVRQLVASLPGTEESTSYGTPAMKVAGKLFARLHQDGENLVLRVEKASRAKLIRGQPEIFHITDHYRDAPYVLLRLATATREDLETSLANAWRLVAE